MNENLWSILTEFTYAHTPESLGQSINIVNTPVQRLGLPETFLQRLNIALKETVTNHIHRPDEEPTTSTVKVRILSNCIALPTQAPSSSWGFFFIEKDQEIEIYLYQDDN